MNNFIKRTITGALFVILIVSSIILSQYLFSLLFLTITILCLNEFYSLTKSEKIIPLKLTGIIHGSLLFISFALASLDIIDVKFLYLNMPLLLLVFVFEMFRRSKNHLNNISHTITGIVYIALPFALLNLYFIPGFVNGDPKYVLLLGFFVLIWIHDVSAYIIGSAIGRNKLFEKISPKKTWEGCVGGLLITLTGGFFLPEMIGELNRREWILMALIIVVSGTFGDLVESMIKRERNVKDSGKLLPGHGGVLDRFDAVLFASPAVFIYLLLIR